GTTTITGFLDPGSTFSSPLNTGSGNMLRIDQAAGGGILGNQGLINGPVQLNVPVGTGGGGWVPLSKGGTPLWFYTVSSLNAPTGGLVEIEAFTPGSGGAPDGISMSSVSGSEYWTIKQLTGSTMTFTQQSLTSAAGAGAGKTLATSTALAGPYSASGSAISSPFYGIASNILNTPITVNVGTTTYLSLGNFIPTYYYNNANVNPGGANNRLNWDTSPGAAYGTAAPNFTTANTAFSIDPGSTAVLTADLPFGAGANNVTLTVPSGATLNTGVYAVQFAGNNSRFTLQNGGTLQTSNANGINGGGNSDGAVQINPPLTTGVVISYGPTANYVLGAIGATTDARFADFSGNKQAITQAASLTVNPGALRTWILSGGPLTISPGALTVQSGTLSLSASLLTFGGAGSIVQNAAALQLNGGAQIVNTGGLTIQSGGRFEVAGVTTLPIVATNPITYDVGSALSYFSHPVLSTGLEFPASMNGSVSIQTGGPLTLNGAKSVNGTFSISGTGALITDNTNMLTIANTADVAVVRSGSGEVRGPMRRALPAGASPGLQWLFPVSKGGTYLPFAVNSPTTVGGATIEVEAYNTAPASADGTTLLGPLGSEYWQAQVTTAPGSFTSGFVQAARAGITAANRIGSSTTAPPTATTYSSNGGNTLGTLTTIPSLTRTATDNLAAPTYFAVGTVPPPPIVTAVPQPAPNGRNDIHVPITSPFQATYNQNLLPASLTGTNIKVHSNFRGVINGAGVFAAAGLNGVSYTPNVPTPLLRGEKISVSLTSGVQNLSSISAAPHVVQFTAAAAGTGIGTFPSQFSGSPYGTGTQPTGAAFGRFNADAFLDLVVTNEGSSNLTIFFGDGAGGFTPNATFATGGSQPRFSVTGDVDNDGDVDIMVQNVGTNNVSIFINNGLGVFAPTPLSPFTVGAAPQQAALGDVNGDGFLDIIAANQGAGTVTVLLNNGLGTNYTASPSSPFTVGAQPYGVAVGDVDNDGDIDIVTSNQSGGAMTVLLNNGSGTYTPKAGSPFASGVPTSIRVTLGDIDGDNDLDAALFSNAGFIAVLLNDGSGGFGTAAPGSPIGYFSNQLYGGTFGDVDADGDLDLVAANWGGAKFLIYKNDGFGAFTLFYDPPTWSSMPQEVALGDVDGDGDLDIAAPDYSNNRVFIYSNAIATYYYNTGDASNPNNWWTGINGTGTQAANFTTPSTTFIVDPSRPTATAMNNILLGAGITMTVQSGCSLVMQNGFTFTNTGNLTIAAGGTLELQGTGAIAPASANPVTYQAATSTLLLTGAATKTVNDREWLPTMNAAVTINKVGSFVVQLDALPIRTQNGILTIQSGTLDVLTAGNLALGAAAHTVQGGAFMRVSSGGAVSGLANVTVNNTATFSLNHTGGTAPVRTGTPNYLMGSTLLYIGTANLAIGSELPTAMTADVDFKNSSGVNLEKGLAYTQNFNGAVTFTDGEAQLGTTLNCIYNFNGAISAAGGGIRPAAGADINILGTGAITGGAIPITMPGALRSLTMNRTGGVVLSLSGSLSVDNGAAAALTLSNGSVRINGGDITTGNSFNGAIAGGSATSYVETTPTGTLIRNTATGNYFFPVHNGTSYMPLTAVNVTTGSPLQVRATTGLGGTADNATMFGALSTDYWYTDAFGLGSMTLQWRAGSPSVLSASNVVGLSGSIGGIFSAVGGANPQTYFAGAPNEVLSSAITPLTIMGPAAPDYLRIGTASPNVYHYFSGDPSVSTNWWSNIGGTGTQAANFTSTGWSFIVPGGYSTSVPTANIPLSAGVSMTVAANGTLNLGPRSVTGAGNFALSAGGTLSTSLATGVSGAITVGGTQTFTPGANYTFNGTAAQTTNIPAPAMPIGNLTAALTGNLTLNAPVTVGAAGIVTVNSGAYIVSTPPNSLSVQNPAPTAVVAAGATGFIEGALNWTLAMGGGLYTYPVGGSIALSKYNPVSLNYGSTGLGTTVEIQAFPTGSGGSAGALMTPTTLSTSEYWRVTPSAALNNATLTFNRPTPPLNGANILGVTAPLAAANTAYNAFPSTVAGADISNTTPFTTVAAGTRFYGIGSSSVYAGFGQALSLNGTSQYTEVNPMPSAAIGTSDFTVEAWIRTANSAATLPVAPLFSVGNSSVANDGLHIYSQGASGRIQLSTSFAWGPSVNAGVNVEDNQWHHIAVVRSGGTISFYVDGVNSGGGAVPGAMNIATGLVRIGALVPGFVSNYDGSIDEVRFWNVALPQATINRHKGVEINTTHPNWANLLGYWKFNEYGGNTALDSKGTNHATLINAPVRTVSGAPSSAIAHPINATLVLLPGMAPPAPVPTYSLTLVPPALLSNVTPSPGNPVDITPTSAIPAGHSGNFTYRIDNTLTNDTKSVTVNFEPRLTGGTQNVPAGVPTALTIPALNGGTLTPAAAVSWNWSPATDLSSSTVQFPTFNGVVNRNYTVTITDALGFTSSALVNVLVTPLSDRYYYQGGDASSPLSWKSEPNGGGTAAPS
ncbi:MAG: FG-GAP-like repeat-containing protein, partial [Candidatus Kapaibacteriota bacterium]